MEKLYEIVVSLSSPKKQKGNRILEILRRTTRDMYDEDPEVQDCMMDILSYIDENGTITNENMNYLQYKYYSDRSLGTQIVFNSAMENLAEIMEIIREKLNL